MTLLSCLYLSLYGCFDTDTCLFVKPFSIPKVFEYLKKYQASVGHELFKDEQEIYSVGWKYAKNEFSLNVYHTHGWCMSLILCSESRCVRVAFSLIDYNIDDWPFLETLIQHCVKEEKKEEPVIVKGFKSFRQH